MMKFLPFYFLLISSQIFAVVDQNSNTESWYTSTRTDNLLQSVHAQQILKDITRRFTCFAAIIIEKGELPIGGMEAYFDQNPDIPFTETVTSIKNIFQLLSLIMTKIFLQRRAPS